MNPFRGFFRESFIKCVYLKSLDMKKLLLILFTLPYLLSAQNVTTNVAKYKSFAKQIITGRQVNDRVSTYSGDGNNQLDSIYIYYGEEKVFVGKASITYDDNGSMVQQKSIFDYDNDGIYDQENTFDYDDNGRIVLEKYMFDEDVDGIYDEGEKSEFLYAQKGNLIEVEEISSTFRNGIWKYYYKSVTYYNPANMYTPVESYGYSHNENEGGWVFSSKKTATEFDEKGRPTVIMDSSQWLDIMTVSCRIVHTYTESGLYSSTTEFRPATHTEPVEVWEPRNREEFIYDEDDKLTKEVRIQYDFDETITDDYDYDEKGNVISVITTLDDGEIESIYLKNFYSSGTDANDVIPAVQSNIYPNPVSDVLHITIDGAENAVITLVNAAGSVVVQQKTNHSITSIPVQSFAKGYYFLIVKTSKGTKTHKVIIR